MESQYLKTIGNLESLRDNLDVFCRDLEGKKEELQFLTEHLDETGLCQEALGKYQEHCLNPLIEDLLQIINEIRTSHFEYIDRMMFFVRPEVFP